MKLRPREEDQREEVIASFERAYRNGMADEIDPIVAFENGEIIDGHHRAIAAERAGIEPEVVTISSEEYKNLASRGYDDMEIACYALLKADYVEAAEALDRQFEGCGMLDKVYGILEGE